MTAGQPFPPPDHPHLRNTRFHEADDGLIERWVWEPGAERWDLRKRKTRAEWDAGSARVIDRGGPSAEDRERALQLAREQGWLINGKWIWEDAEEET